MTDTINIKIEDDGYLRKISGSSHDGKADLLIKETMHEIGSRIEETAKLLAPSGKTGELKAHPVDVSESEGVVETRAALFGGGFALQGLTGFVKGVGSLEAGGKVVSHLEITVAKEPKHAIWVHEGTGLFGEHHSPIVPHSSSHLLFHAYGKRWRVKSVKGQQPQPYLTEAYEEVDKVYVPMRVERLRAEVELLYR